jgi:hypothetical protein
VTTFGTTLGLAPGSLWQSGSIQAQGAAANFSSLGQTSQSPATVTITPVSTHFGPHDAARSEGEAAASSPGSYVSPGELPPTDRGVLDGLIPSQPRTGQLSDAFLDELARDPDLWLVQRGNGTIRVPVLPTDRSTRDPVIGAWRSRERIDARTDEERRALLWRSWKTGGSSFEPLCAWKIASDAAVELANRINRHNWCDDFDFQVLKMLSSVVN